MKKILLLKLFMIAATVTVAQNIRLNLYSAYVFDDKISSYYNSYTYFEGTVKGGYQWGGGVEYLVRPEYGVELLYYRQDTHAPITFQGSITNPVEFENLDLGVNCIMLGANRYKTLGEGKIEGYGGFLGGIGIISGKSSRQSDTLTKFAWGLRLGVNIWASEKVGIKLQAQLLSVAQGAGGGMYFGTGGAGVGVSTYSTIYQFGLGGGLTFNVGQ